MSYNPQIHHRRSVRLKGYDYTQAGAYFITICTKAMQCLFGQVENDEMNLNPFGQIAYNEWLRTPQLRRNVSLDVFEIMPNHMHGIIIIDEPLHVINSPNATGEAGFNLLTPISSFRSPSNTVGAIVRGYKSAVTKQINLLGHEDAVWQGNYHEHIIRNEKEYQRISDYIVNNTRNWQQDKFYR